MKKYDELQSRETPGSCRDGNRTRTFKVAADGAYETTSRGQQVLETPALNKGSAFSHEERNELGLCGLLPPAVTTIEVQAARSYAQYCHQRDDLAKYIFLTALHDRNEVLYYRVLREHLAEMLPIVYTPTVGDAIERYSQEFQRPRGVYLCIDDPDGIDAAFENLGVGPDDIDLIVATDADQILGIGDWGVGGIAICVGKLDLYTAAAGIDPERVIPVMLDVGTDRDTLLSYPAYMGARHRRDRGKRYDAFIDAYVRAATSRFPRALLHWEDFGAGDARRILERYRNQICTFNDDMQGTGAVVLGGVLAATRAAGIRFSEHRVVIFGAGTAGIGIADFITSAMTRDGLTADEARRRIWCLGSHGLVVEGMRAGMRDFQRAYARAAAEVQTWQRQGEDIDLLEVVRQVQPTLLIGCAAQPGAFTEETVREMAAHADRPIVFALSNPTSLSEATPADLINWSDGRALVATGSPFPPVVFGGTTYAIGQANNAFVFPGLGLGVIAVKARAVSDGMLIAAADTVAQFVDASRPGAPVMPTVDRVRELSVHVASAVARAAIAEGLAQTDTPDVMARVRGTMWEPAYRAVRPAGRGALSPSAASQTPHGDRTRQVTD
ncbi:MAG TPA: NAD-dependent malic enzyme [Candidatus Saccharimonadales bacterium]|nr:NAD-dependent malic enzyme [Candidatus Saccharimonadales bacterium]